VAQWLSVKIGRRPQGLRNMEEVWTEWVRATETPLTPDVVLTGRDEDQTAGIESHVFSPVREATWRPRACGIGFARMLLRGATDRLPNGYRGAR
jgi:hypothetical protein